MKKCAILAVRLNFEAKTATETDPNREFRMDGENIVKIGAMQRQFVLFFGKFYYLSSKVSFDVNPWKGAFQTIFKFWRFKPQTFWR